MGGAGLVCEGESGACNDSRVTPGSQNITIPNNWKSGRIWGRRNCNFNNNLPGYQQCATGGPHTLSLI